MNLPDIIEVAEKISVHTENFFAASTRCIATSDLLFNIGNAAPWYIWGWRND